MATGCIIFKPPWIEHSQERWKNSIPIFLLFLCFCGEASGLEISVIGLTSGKAVLVIDGSKPRTLHVGDNVNGVKLISADSETAVVEIDGKRHHLTLGPSIATSFAPAERASLTLSANSAGHFVSTGNINNATVRFLIDTGATLVVLGANEARRIGIDYLKGERGISETAGGAVAAYRIKLDTVKLGDIVLNNVDGMVNNADMPYVLLGMSFLSRLEMKREGDSMTLVKRY